MSTSDCRQPAGRARARWARAFGFAAIIALALAFGAGARAQTTPPQASVDFATIGVRSGVSITLNVSYTDPTNNPVSSTFTFTSPGPSTAIATMPGTPFTFSFPASLADGTAAYTLDRVFTPSPFTTGAAGATTHVQARYGLLVDFATSGLPDGVSLSAVVSYTNGRGIGISNQAVAIQSPNVSTPIITQLGTHVTFSYPASVTVGGQTFPLVSVFPASGFTTGAAGTSTHVVATYGSIPPALSAAASQTASEGTSSSFDLGSFVDPDGGPWSVEVDWGDGSAHTTFAATSAGSLGTQSHTYADNGTYTATVKITDSTSLSDSKSFAVAVDNVAPTPSISGAPASGAEGTAISLTGLATDPSSVDTAAGFSFNWSVSKNGSSFAAGSGASFSFTPDDNGSYVVTLTATDKDSGTAPTSATIAVTNVAPTASILGAPTTSPEGTPITLASMVTDPSSADTGAGFVYAWSVKKNGTLFASGTAAGVTFTPDDDGSYVVTLTAADKEGDAGSDSKTITVTDAAPTASISGAPATSPEGTAISLTGSATDPSAADTAAGFTLSWSVTKNGSPFVTGSAASFSFTPDDNGSYVVTLSASDKDGQSGSASATIDVTNVAPAPSITGAPAGSAEGTAVSLTGSAADPSPVDTAASFTFNWSVSKDGSSFATGSGASFSFTPDDNGSYVVTLTATDKDSGAGSTSATIAVTNVAPAAAINGAPAASPEGTPIALTSTVTDPSSADTTTGFASAWTVKKNGSPFASGSAASFAFTPDDNGTYVVTLVVADKDHGAGTDSKTITVSNVSPTAAISGAPASSAEGTAISLTSTVSDPSSADTAAGFTSTWTVTKNGSPFASGSAASFSFTPDDDGAYVVTLAAKDKDGGTGTDSKTVTVTDAAPSVADLTANGTVLVNESLAVSTTFSDPGADYPWQATFNWGDGSTPVLSPVGPTTGPAVNVPLSLSHSYSSNVTHQVRVDVTDQNGATGSSNLKSVKVLYGFAALFAQSASGKSYKKGSTIPVKLQIRDFLGNVSSPAILVQATGLSQTSTSANAEVLDSGNANPDSDFRFDSGLHGYIFNLSTKDLSTGTWRLSFTINGQSDPGYSVTFDVR